MKTKLLIFTVTALMASPVLGCGSYEGNPLTQFALQAVSADADISAKAIARLREHGAGGVEALCQTHAALLEQHRSSITPIKNEMFERLRNALDQVGQQRDCHASRLFWHTDFDQARAAAQASGKPILSLRLLGKLNEEFSCANSRFFRTTLYANAEVSKYLRDNFILHWQSVRPVPKVTIDFGDGRKVERTVTGNSIHYVLDTSGRVIDALPGLYAANDFLAGLARADAAAKESIKLGATERAEYLRQYHNERVAAITSEFAADLAKVGTALPEPIVAPVSNVQPVPARVAMRTTLAKMNVEEPLLRLTDPRATFTRWQQLRDTANDAVWTKIAALRRDAVRLDASSRDLIRAKNPNALEAGRLAVSKRIVEDPLVRLVDNLERSIAEDTVRNEYVFHTQIHQWLAADLSADVSQLNNRVYAELFLTPNSDPWLGLAEGGAFTALENNGLIQLSGGTVHNN